MTKQEFIAFSLPYELKFIEYDEYTTYPKIHTLEFNGLTPVHHFLKDSFKPICRSLSDLTKEIEHGGEVFVPIVIFSKMRSSNLSENIFDKAFDILKFDIKTMRLPFDMFKKLIEWHFDVAGLIDKGEAIDINTLETNPYK